MKRTLKTIEEELKSIDLHLEVVPKWSRDRSRKGTKQFYVTGGGTRRWTGDDGESNYSPRLCLRITVKSISEITLDLVRSEYIRQSDGRTLEEGLQKAKKEEEKDAKEFAKREAEYEVRKAEEQKAKDRKLTEQELSERKRNLAIRFSASDEDKLNFFNHTVQAIVSDDYRKEFLDLVNNTEFFKLVLDTLILPKACFDYGFYLALGRAVGSRKIPHFSIGGPRFAFDYFTQDWEQ
jgi:hypothetical protein